MTQSPYTVSTPNGVTKLLVMDARDGLPAAFALMGTQAKAKVAIRVTGGCKGMNATDKAEMMAFFSAAFSGYQGVIFSGGTRAVVNGEIDPMVTDVPGVIATGNPGCIALGTAPRTDIMTLQDDSRLMLDQWNAPNPSMSGILIVQDGPDGNMDWDGDLPTYFALMEQWKNHAGFTALGTIAWNGGAVTEDEIMHSIKKGWMTVLVNGSGRVTDEIISKLHFGDIEHRDHIKIVDKADPETLTEFLVQFGFFPQLAVAA